MFKPERVTQMRIGVYGAGSIGCYVGGCLAAAGVDVVLVGRARVLTSISSHGLRLTDYLGRDVLAQAQHLSLSESPEALADVDLVLLTMKSAGTADAASTLAGLLPRHVPVVSFQNGVRNVPVLREQLPNHAVLAGMVPFNVIDRGEGRFHQGSEGQLDIEVGPLPAGAEAAFASAGLPLLRSADMQAVQWGKLLMNLNNSVNALSGLPLKEELSLRGYRRVLALAIAEALGVLRKAGVPVAKVTAVPPRLLPWVLSIPDWLFALAARKILAIDPLARSSMWEDLQLGRRTEIDWINGEVVRLALRNGLHAPVNAALITLIRQAEEGGGQRWLPADLLAHVKQRRLKLPG